MTKIVTLSEAASIGLHAMVIISQSGKSLVNVNTIAERTATSKHHIAKIVQRLAKVGMLNSSRGPSGGFTLKACPEKTTFLDIYEAIEGKIEISECPHNNPVCPFDKCIMNNVIGKMTNEFRTYMESQYLSDYLTKTI